MKSMRFARIRARQKHHVYTRRLMSCLSLSPVAASSAAVFGRTMPFAACVRTSDAVNARMITTMTAAAP
jgi:hypothetical protein